LKKKEQIVRPEAPGHLVGALDDLDEGDERLVHSAPIAQTLLHSMGLGMERKKGVGSARPAS